MSRLGPDRGSLEVRQTTTALTARLASPQDIETAPACAAGEPPQVTGGHRVED